MALTLLAACDSGGPRAGETITPQLTDPLSWTAGQSGQVTMRLVALDREGRVQRRLDFHGIPDNVNPVATVTFYGSDYVLPERQIVLDHRC
jgi:hypothetical protein